MLLTLSQAARIEGAPSQPALFRMTKNRVLPPFLVKTGEGWRVDTDMAEWEAKISGGGFRSGRQETANIIKAVKKPRARIETDDEGDEEVDAVENNVRKAANAKIIHNARREKYNADLDEIKLNEAKGNFVERGEAEYWFSFFQRGITGTFSSVKRIMPEVKRLLLQGDDLEAEKYLNSNIKEAFERAVEAQKAAIAGEVIDD